MSLSELRAKVVLIDIEGTTTSISFVHEKLFPYAIENAKNYLEETWPTDATKQIVKDLQQLPEFTEFLETLEEDSREINETLIAVFVRYLIDRDLKVTPLKTLQGFIWARGYAAGDLKGHVYDDVPKAFDTWRDSGLRIAVYSSGSVAAQKLLFMHSIAGDLLSNFSAHFDTRVGFKQESASYKTIAQILQVETHHVLFLTDMPGEADAARAAGMQTIILQRPGNAPLSEEHKKSFMLVDDFEALHELKQP